MKAKILVPLFAVAALILVCSQEANAGLFCHRSRCCAAPSCCEQSCCTPEPSCCMPEPSCCEQPSCCEPAPCCGRRHGCLHRLFHRNRGCCNTGCGGGCGGCDGGCGAAPSCGCGY